MEERVTAATAAVRCWLHHTQTRKRLLGLKDQRKALQDKRTCLHHQSSILEIGVVGKRTLSLLTCPCSCISCISSISRGKLSGSVCACRRQSHAGEAHTRHMLCYRCKLVVCLRTCVRAWNTRTATRVREKANTAGTRLRKMWPNPSPFKMSPFSVCFTRRTRHAAPRRPNHVRTQHLMHIREHMTYKKSCVKAERTTS